MRTMLEFASPSFPPEPGEEEEVNPGRWGRRLARAVAEGLRARGFDAAEPEPTDWGWRVDVATQCPAPVWIGCGNRDETENGFLIFVEPSRPQVRKLFRKIDTSGHVEPVAEALHSLLAERDDVSGLEWVED